MRLLWETLEEPFCETLWLNLVEGEVVAMRQGIICWESSSTIQKKNDSEDREICHQDTDMTEVE